VIGVSKEVGLEENRENTVVVVMSRHQLVTATKSFGKVTKFKYFGITITNEDCIHEEIKRKINSGNACYHFCSESYVFPCPLRKLEGF
jgi:hypothetical protein